jgi:hypothetical protein
VAKSPRRTGNAIGVVKCRYAANHAFSPEHPVFGRSPLYSPYFLPIFPPFVRTPPRHAPSLATFATYADSPGLLQRIVRKGVAEEHVECCHGAADEHLRRPVPGSIVNPAELALAKRDSVCEQCHLAGEVRAQSPDGQIKVVSHVEQLALSACARRSGGRSWCGNL